MRSRSSGGIVLNTRNQVILIRQEEGTWSFPKGHVEENEDEEQTARREICEEAGITQLELVKPLGSYQRKSLDERTEEKTITLFLYRTNEMHIKTKAADSIEARWVDLQDVVKLLTHPKDAQYFVSVQDDVLAHLH